MKIKDRAIVKALFLILMGTFLQYWVIGLIPFHKLPISQFWQVILLRTFSTMLSLGAIWFFCPHALSRITARMERKKIGICILIIAFLLTPSFIGSQILNFHFSQILQGLVFALFIGIDEEFFSRGFIYGALEGYGVGIAATVSALHFGLLHLGNIFWGGQSVSYTSSQVIGAAAFGYLAAALMIFSGTIWIPILMHGLSDSPMQFESTSQFTKEVTGTANWSATLVQALFYIILGFILIYMSNINTRLKFNNLIRRFGLVDAEG